LRQEVVVENLNPATGDDIDKNFTLEDDEMVGQKSNETATGVEAVSAGVDKQNQLLESNFTRRYKLVTDKTIRYTDTLVKSGT